MSARWAANTCQQTRILQNGSGLWKAFVGSGGKLNAFTICGNMPERQAVFQQVITMIIGDSAQFAIECVIQDWVDDIWVFGHFRFWLGGHTVGDWEDTTSLKGCVSWMRDFLDTDMQRFHPVLTGKSKEEVFYLLFDSVMDPSVQDPASPFSDTGDTYRRYHISHLGMSSFNRVGLLLVEEPEYQRVIWHETGDATIHEVRLPVGEMQRIVEAFCLWFQEQQKPNV